MAKFDYSRPTATANRLIDRFGQTGAIRRTVITPPANNWEEASEVTTYHRVTLVPLPISEKRIDGTLILSGDKQVLISAQGLTIDIVAGDIVMFNGSFAGDIYSGEEWTIKDPGRLDPGAVTVVYDAVARR